MGWGESIELFEFVEFLESIEFVGLVEFVESVELVSGVGQETAGWGQESVTVAILYSEHLMVRMALRGIESELPEMVFNQADSHYLDTQTDNFVAVKRMVFQGKERDVALSYNKLAEDILLITLHPLQDGQRERRIRSGRWQIYEPESAL